MLICRYLLVVAAVWTAAAGASDAWLEGQFDIRSGYGTSSHEWQEQKAQLQLAGQWETGSTGGFRLAGLGVYDHVYSRSEYAGTPAEDLRNEWELKDAYWLYEGATYALTMGTQQVTWGEGDYYRVLDVIHPLDVRYYLLNYIDDFSLAKQSLAMVNLEWFGDDWTQQWLWIPEFKETLLPPSMSRFASPNLEWVYQTWQGLPEDKPADFSLVDSSTGVRLSRGFDWADMALYGYYGWNGDPVIGREVSWQRRTVLGISLSRAVGAWVLRNDSAVWLDDAVGFDGSGFVERHRGHILLGADLAEQSYSLSLQAYQTWIIDPGPEASLQLPAQELAVSLYGDYRLLGDDLMLSALVLHNFDTEVGLVELKTEYRLQDNIMLSALLDLFWGDDDHTLLGGYQDQNQITAKISYYF